MAISNFIYADFILILKFLQVFDILKCFYIVKITKVTHERMTKTRPHCVFSSVCFSWDSVNPAISFSTEEKTRISRSSSITHVRFFSLAWRKNGAIFKRNKPKLLSRWFLFRLSHVLFIAAMGAADIDSRSDDFHVNARIMRLSTLEKV